MFAPEFGLNVWILLLGSGHEKQKEQLILWLKKRGISCQALKDASCKVGIVLLDRECTDESSILEIQILLNQENCLLAIDVGAPELPFYMISRLLDLGVIDVVHWKYQETIADHIHSRLIRLSIIEKILASDEVKKNPVGSSPIWNNTLRKVIEAACFSQASILILGESGTGKELIGRLIHELDRRLDKGRLILLDCSTLVPELAGSEFFGHEKGAYTNASSIREGAFALADKGSLFLDEVGELPIGLQAALLRVIQEGTYKRLGSNQWRKTEFRLISATNRNITQEIREKNFREDLFFRINTCTIRLPPLRERKEDIPELISFFLTRALNTDAPPPVSKSLIKYLMLRDYRGNVRELQQLVARIAYRYPGKGIISLGCLSPEDRLEEASDLTKEHPFSFRDAIRRSLGEGLGFKEIKRMAGDAAMEIAVKQANNHLPTAAQQLGVSERLVQSWWAERKR